MKLVQKVLKRIITQSVNRLSEVHYALSDFPTLMNASLLLRYLVTEMLQLRNYLGIPLLSLYPTNAPLLIITTQTSAPCGLLGPALSLHCRSLTTHLVLSLMTLHHSLTVLVSCNMSTSQLTTKVTYCTWSAALTSLPPILMSPISPFPTAKLYFLRFSPNVTKFSKNRQSTSRPGNSLQQMLLLCSFPPKPCSVSFTQFVPQLMPELCHLNTMGHQLELHYKKTGLTVLNNMYLINTSAANNSVLSQLLQTFCTNQCTAFLDFI